MAMDRIEQTLNEVEKEPLSANAWLTLGSVLFDHSELEYAKEAYERALILDPHGNWTKPSINNSIFQPKDFNLKPHYIDAIAKLFQVKPVTVTAGILVKNEEKVIQRCISSLIDAVDEIVIIDTGSTDHSKEIIQSFPKIKLIEFPWCDDFSAARNAGFAHMTSDWVIWVDADEYLHPDDVQAIRIVASMFQEYKTLPILRIGQLNHVQGSISPNYDQARMFPLRNDLRFRYRVHEQIHSIEGKETFSRAVRIRLFHDGYEPSIVQSKDKVRRNLLLLQKMVVENPDNPTCLLFLGRETLGIGDIDNAIRILNKAEQAAKITRWFGRTLEIYKYLIHAYLMKADLDRAEQICYKALQIHEQFPDALYALACIQKEKALRLCIEAEEHVMQTKSCFETYHGNSPADKQILEWKADLILADLSLLYGNLPKAKMVYKELLKKRPKLEKIINQLEFIESVRKELNQEIH